MDPKMKGQSKSRTAPSITFNDQFALESKLLDVIEKLPSLRIKQYLHFCSVLGFTQVKKQQFVFPSNLYGMSVASNSFREGEYEVPLYDEELLLYYRKLVRPHRIEFIRNCTLYGFLLTLPEYINSVQGAEVDGRDLSKSPTDDATLDRLNRVGSEEVGERMNFSGMIA